MAEVDTTRKEVCSSRNNTRAGLGFLDLPGEVRNEIYHLALVDDQHRLNLDPYSRLNKDSISASTALLCTCRQVYNEGLLIFYRENTFRKWTRSAGEFPSTDDYIPSGLSTQRVGLIQDLDLYFSHGYIDRMARHLHDIFDYLMQHGCVLKKLRLYFRHIGPHVMGDDFEDTEEIGELISAMSLSTVHEELDILVDEAIHDLVTARMKYIVIKMAKQIGWNVTETYGSSPPWSSSLITWRLRPKQRQ